MLCLHRAEGAWCIREDGRAVRERDLDDVVMSARGMYEYYLRKNGTVFWSKEPYDSRGAPPPPAGVFDGIGKVAALTGSDDDGNIMLLSADSRVYRWKDELVAEDPEYEAELQRGLNEVKVPERVRYLADNGWRAGVGESGSAYDFGDQKVATPLRGNPPPGVVALTSGAGHDCLLTDQGKVYCRGDNSRAQLGLGTRSAGSIEFKQVSLAAACRIRAQHDTTYAVLMDGSVWFWGGRVPFVMNPTERDFPQRAAGLTEVSDLRFGIVLRRDGTLERQTKEKRITLEFQ